MGRNLESFNDEDVWRGGTLIKNPAGWWIFTQLRTDSRKMVQLELNPILHGTMIIKILKRKSVSV